MRQSILIGAVLATIANLFWAANAIVGKAVIASLPAFTLSQFRWWLAFCLLAPFGLPRVIRQWHWYRANLPRLSLLSLLSVTFYNTFQYWSLEFTEPVKVGAMLALMPLAIAIVSGFLGGRKQTWIEWLTSILAVIGALTVITNGDWRLFLVQQQAWNGELLMILAIISWAFYSVMLKATPHESVDTLGLLTFFMGIGSLFIVPFWLVDISRGEVFFPQGNLWWSVAFVAVFPSIISFLCWNKAIKLADATVAGLMVTTAPLFNALLSMFFLNAVVSVTQWIGIAIVIIGVASTLLLSKRIAQSR